MLALHSTQTQNFSTHQMTLGLHFRTLHRHSPVSVTIGPEAVGVPGTSVGCLFRLVGGSRLLLMEWSGLHRDHPRRQPWPGVVGKCKASLSYKASLKNKQHQKDPGMALASMCQHRQSTTPVEGLKNPGVSTTGCTSYYLYVVLQLTRCSHTSLPLGSVAIHFTDEWTDAQNY